MCVGCVSWIFEELLVIGGMCMLMVLWMGFGSFEIILRSSCKVSVDIIEMMGW